MRRLDTLWSGAKIKDLESSRFLECAPFAAQRVGHPARISPGFLGKFRVGNQASRMCVVTYIKMADDWDDWAEGSAEENISITT